MDSVYVAYLKDLGLDDIFRLDIPYEDFFNTNYYKTIINGNHRELRGQLHIILINENYKVNVSCTSTAEWTDIEGSLVERRDKVLTYLADTGFQCAAAALRKLKIDHLLA